MDIDIGDKVALPTYYKTRKSQKRTCIVVNIFFKKGKEYIQLAGMLKNGKPSKDLRQQIYWRVNEWNCLIKLDNEK